MKLLRVGSRGNERPAVLVEGQTAVDVSDIVDDFDAQFFARGEMRELKSVVDDRASQGRLFDIAGKRIGAPIARPHQILCIGLNYVDHAKESQMSIPSEPVVFSKAPNSLAGPYDQIIRPPRATKLDYEVELGVVIGSRCQYLESDNEALQAIAGLTLVNDVSERKNQLEREGQWIKGKSSESFNPCGPYLVTPDEFTDSPEIDLWLDVNGARRQTGNTRDMIFNVATIVRYLSQFFVLEPGDLINTGTPPGVALGMPTPEYLQPGDVVTLGGTGLGLQSSEIVDFHRFADIH